MATWPRHKAKASQKRSKRTRTIADLAREQLRREKAYGVRV